MARHPEGPAAIADRLDGHAIRVVSELVGALARAHDVVVLDVGPRDPCLLTLRAQRAAGLRTPTIVLVDGDVEDRVRGLEAGADLCLCRSVTRRELGARLRAVRRRATERSA